MTYLTGKVLFVEWGYVLAAVYVSHQKSSDRCLQLCLAGWYTGSNSIIIKKGGEKENKNRKNNRIKKR